MAYALQLLSLIVIGCLYPVNGGPVPGSGKEVRITSSAADSLSPSVISAVPEPKAKEPLSFLQAVKSFNLTEAIPNSAMLRFLVHAVRTVLIGLIVCLWLFCAIQTFVSVAKCCEFLFLRREKDGGAGEAPESTPKLKFCIAAKKDKFLERITV